MTKHSSSSKLIHDILRVIIPFLFRTAILAHSATFGNFKTLDIQC